MVVVAPDSCGTRHGPYDVRVCARRLKWAGVAAGLALASSAGAGAPIDAGTSTRRETVASSTVTPDLRALLDAYADLARYDLWPDFEPMDMPLEVFDGSQTYLIRHPKPPEGFIPVPGLAGVVSSAGRHAAVRANHSATVNGVAVAVADLSRGGMAHPKDSAALLIHEAFHVYQRAHHPRWIGDETQAFLYPLENLSVVTDRKLEDRSLLHAITATTPAETRCWARKAMAYRTARMKHLPQDVAAYERGTELNEGLAEYVAQRGLGNPELPSLEGLPEEIRRHAQDSGRALALVLEKLSPAWRARFEKDQATQTNPLLDGVQRISIAGLTRAPAVTQQGSAITVEADGLSAHFDKAQMQQQGNTLHIRIADAP